MINCEIKIKAGCKSRVQEGFRFGYFVMTCIAYERVSTLNSVASRLFWVVFDAELDDAFGFDVDFGCAFELAASRAGGTSSTT